MNKRSAISKIEKAGVLLVFPIKNAKEPNSLWREFYPRKKMIWDWNEDAEDNVANLWMLMKKLSDCREVVYSKWYQGRATFFSRKVFTAILAQFRKKQELPLSRNAELIYDSLLESSPRSTKELKEAIDMQGKFNSSAYDKACKELFQSLRIVAFGEVDDGSFPSLCVGATKSLYEDLFQEAQNMSPKESQKIIDQYLPKGSAFRKFLDKHIYV